MFLLNWVGQELKLFIHFDIFTVEIVFTGEYETLMTIVFASFYSFVFAIRVTPLGPNKKSLGTIGLNEFLQYAGLSFTPY